MKRSTSEQESIVGLLARIQADIGQIETEYGLLVGEGDYRPRIEYFHDAVRAFTAGDTGNKRLSVEWLAYDLNALRYIHAMPLSPLSKHQNPLSPGSGLIVTDPKGLAVHPKKPDRDTRQRLVDLYQHYALLFAALLKIAADKDYQARTDALNQDVRDIHTLIEQFDHGKLDAAINTIHHLEDPKLRQELLSFLHQQKQKKREELQKLLSGLKKTAKDKDKEADSVEKAHLDYGRAQLAIYEGAKDILKKMAKSGMNLAGRFVESAMAETQREMGR